MRCLPSTGIGRESRKCPGRTKAWGWQKCVGKWVGVGNGVGISVAAGAGSGVKAAEGTKVGGGWVGWGGKAVIGGAGAQDANTARITATIKTRIRPD